MESRAAVAARNNAEWCDLVCRTHGFETRFDPDLWIALRRPPPLYPDAVTLIDRLPAGEVLRRVDSSSGCSIKDSFASVDLTSEGFRLLLEAEWIYREPTQHQAEDAAGWSVVRTPGQLLAWGAAHGRGEVFRPELVSDSAVAIAVTHHGGGIAAGAIGHRSASVVGVSNLFTVTADADRAWAGAIAAISARFPGMPMVGYQDSAGLPAAHHAGFVSVGPLRVWLKD